MEATAEVPPKETLENVLPESNNDKEKTPSPPPQERPKKSKKEERAKKDDRNAEQYIKSLNSLMSPEEKFSSLSKKYLQIAEENKKLQFYVKQSDKRHTLLMKEKEQLQHEFNKTVLVKSKLENLCRELQKQNKAIKEESLLKIREEEERRKETQAKFQNTLSEITSLLQQNNEKNAKLRDDNISMSEKFKSVVQQYQLREQQVDKMAKQMALESQLSDAKLQKASLEHQAERERLVAEMEQLKMTLAQYRAKITELQGTETALKGQLAVYTDKYDEFQNALVKSNQVFGGFKEQMETMSKKIKKLEKESLSWKKRWETSQTALLDMCGERQASEERAAATARQLQHMQSLCRTLQAERTVLLNSLKEHNIERPPLPAPVAAPAPPPPAPAPNNNAKVDAMVANCAQLRQSLAQLQSQLNVLTNNKMTPKEEPAKPEKQKKSKSKKNKAQGIKAGEKNGLQKETESDESSPKDSANVQNDTSPNDAEDKADGEFPSNKIDEKTVENLIKAINMANMNLCELEVENDKAETENVLAVEETTKVKIVDEKTNPEVVNESTKAEVVNESTKPEINDSTKAENVIDKPVIETIVNTESTKVVNSSEPVEEIKPSNISSNKKTNEIKEIGDVPHVESSPNEEVSHIDEVKPIVAADA